jgi:hypothetical protein
MQNKKIYLTQILCNNFNIQLYYDTIKKGIDQEGLTFYHFLAYKDNIYKILY